MDLKPFIKNKESIFDHLWFFLNEHSVNAIITKLYSISGQGFSTYDTNCEDEYDMDPVQRKLKAQKLSEALAVLAIRPPSFNSLFTAGRLEQVCMISKVIHEP